MFVWTGHGWIGFVIIVGSILGIRGLIGQDAVFHAPTVGLIIFLSVLPCHFIGRRLNRNAPRKVFDAPKIERNPSTGELEHYPSTGHTVAYLRLEYAGWIVILPIILMWLERAGFFD